MSEHPKELTRETFEDTARRLLKDNEALLKALAHDDPSYLHRDEDEETETAPT